MSIREEALSSGLTRQGHRAGFGKPNLAQSAVWITLVGVVILGIMLTPNLMAIDHWPVLLRQAAPLGLLAIGQTVLVLGRGFDLSVGGVVGMVSVIAAGSYAQTHDVWMTIAICLGVGLLTGVVNGSLVAWAGLSPLIVTLGTGFVLSGAMLVYTGGAPTGSVPDGIRLLASGRLFGISWGTYAWFLIAILVALVLKFTWMGRWVYALGNSPEAARLSGVKTGQVKFYSHIFASLCAAGGGLLLAGFVGVGSLGAGQDLVLNSLAATIVGGTMLVGGRGGVSGTVGGAILLTVITALLTGVGIGKSGELLTQGIVIVAAAALFRKRVGSTADK
ncbi:ABC transporter permease [Arthrobacter sp. MYb227]|uniref:ABC transporter permease n=1 Tax=Arthrobacter sp. MYb227 TaxID=1848601 RepID=UPI0015E3280E|nr:ABC transporter permease [Arthrobacter sp. MYb227]